MPRCQPCCHPTAPANAENPLHHKGSASAPENCTLPSLSAAKRPTSLTPMAVSEESLIAFEWVTERSITTRLASRIGFDREAMKYGTLALMLVRWLRL